MAKKKKKVEKIVKLQIAAGKASPAPPIGPALGGAGINIMGFCQEFNKQTQSMGGQILPVVISVYGDKSFDFILKQPPVAEQLKKVLGISKGSGVPNQDKVGKLTRAQALEIVENKQQDMNARDKEAAIKIVAGTARSMGIDFVDE